MASTSMPNPAYSVPAFNGHECLTRIHQEITDFLHYQSHVRLTAASSLPPSTHAANQQEREAIIEFLKEERSRIRTLQALFDMAENNDMELQVLYEDSLVTVTTRYGLLHYANLIRRTGPYCFSFNLLNLATPLLSYAVRLVLLIFVLLSLLPCYLYDAVLILTLDILYSLIDTFLSIFRYISTHVFVVEP
jgi:hypothetical protein